MIDFESPNVWNDWRTNYKTMKSSEHLEFYNWLEANYPSQKHFTSSCWDQLFKDLMLPRVLEVGGWKGELAEHCLGLFNIARWINVEICMRAINKQAFKSPKYYTYYPGDFWWYKSNPTFEADVLVSSHTIEHLSNEDFLDFSKWASQFPVVAFESPLSEDFNDWTDNISTHILTYGFSQVDDIMVSYGFKVAFSTKHFRIYKK